MPKRSELGIAVTKGEWRTVCNALKDSFKDWRSIIPQLRYHYIDHFYSFTMAGMFVGVELDRYIHT